MIIHPQHPQFDQLEQLFPHSRRGDDVSRPRRRGAWEILYETNDELEPFRREVRGESTDLPEGQHPRAFCTPLRMTSTSGYGALRIIKRFHGPQDPVVLQGGLFLVEKILLGNDADNSDDLADGDDIDDSGLDNGRRNANNRKEDRVLKVPQINTKVWTQRVRAKKNRANGRMQSCLISSETPQPQSSAGEHSQRTEQFGEEESSEYLYPCPYHVLDRLLEECARRYPERYGELLKREADIKEVLQDLLRKRVREVFEGGNYSKKKLLSIGGTIPKGTGIYLHILWDEDDPDHFYLYVGQSTQTEQRISHHNDPIHRASYPSLHYFVWGKLGSPVKSVWMMLSCPKPQIEVNELTLNMLEMWCALILQSLPKITLSSYLPDIALSPRAGNQLNVASPLTQANPRTQEEGDKFRNGHILLDRDNALALSYWRNQMAEYHALRYSDDPILRDYWWAADRRRAEAHSSHSREKRRKRALEGTEVNLKFWGGQRYFEIGPHRFYFPMWNIGPCSKTPIHVQFAVMDNPDEDRYAMNARDDEDAARMVLRVKGVLDDSDEKFECLASVGSDVNALYMNSFYDVLVGRTLTESKNLPRRKWKTEVVHVDDGGVVRKQSRRIGSSYPV